MSTATNDATTATSGTTDQLATDAPSGLRTTVRTGISQLVVLVSWAAVYLVLLLGAIAVLVTVTTGWNSVIISSNSMSPTLRAGDVMFLGDRPDEPIGQNSVITFERPADGSLVTHRVFETLVDEHLYVTKGDANPTPDSDIVGHDQIIGVGQLVIPFLGLPVVWMNDGNVAPLIALALLAVAALAAVVVSSRHRPDESEAEDRFSSGAQRGITRVRLVVALMIAMQLVVDGRQFELAALGLTRVQTILAAISALALISVISAVRARRASTPQGHRLATMELVGDTLVVVFFVASSGTTGIGWILMALPIIEAAIHFRLTGAFVHWMVMSALSVAAFFWTNTAAGTPGSVLLGDLEQLIDRLGVLLIVVIPASYLAEQLLGDVLTQRRATRLARERSRIIERVSEAGRDVTRLGSDPFDTIVRATLDLGFDAADAWAGDPTGGWRRLASCDNDVLLLPAPGHPGSALRADDLQMPEVSIDPDDPDEAEYEALADTGAEVLIRMTLTQRDGMHVVLRAAATTMSDDLTSQVMALRLLSGQGAVALQNEALLSELKQTHFELEHQAMFDALTGLPNRARFVGLLGDGLRHDPDGHEITVVMFLDLNGFKVVNDRLGHNAGDELLATVANRFREAVGDRGVVARLGGDEFTVMLADGTCEARADEVADDIHLALSRPFDISGEQVRVGASIGIAFSEPFMTVSEILRRADVAMYTAKGTSGAWQTITYRIELEENERRTQRLGHDFDRALALQQVSLVYQPILDIVTGAIVGAEALIRWTHPDLGAVPAPEIIDVAEASGNVDTLNAWIFRTALTEVAQLCTGDGPAPFIAVNVSPRELELESLPANMAAAIEASGLDASQVVVELSERIVAEARGSIRNIDVLTEMGVALALDDFGEGRTSLAHLRGFPITYLKLDRVFVQHAGEVPTDRTILHSVVALAHDLGFSVIAEGIETPEHRTIVGQAGAQLGQGYGLHRPMSLSEYAKLLAPSPGSVPPPAIAASEPLAGTVFPPPRTDAARVG